MDRLVSTSCWPPPCAISPLRWPLSLGWDKAREEWCCLTGDSDSATALSHAHTHRHTHFYVLWDTSCSTWPPPLFSPCAISLCLPPRLEGGGILLTTGESDSATLHFSVTHFYVPWDISFLYLPPHSPSLWLCCGRDVWKGGMLLTTGEVIQLLPMYFSLAHSFMCLGMFVCTFNWPPSPQAHCLSWPPLDDCACTYT